MRSSALTIAGAPAGSDALALFYLEPRKPDGRWRNIAIDRLKDKLGTRELPTAEIHLNGTPAELVGEAKHGVRQITPVLNWSPASAPLADDAPVPTREVRHPPKGRKHP